MGEIKIGDALYRFDRNHRVYARDATGRANGAPIYAEHFERGEVIGETKLSWLCRIAHGERKVNKKTMLESVPGWSSHRWYTEAQKDDAIWIKENRHHLAERVARCNDAATLRGVLMTFNVHEGVACVLGRSPKGDA